MLFHIFLPDNYRQELNINIKSIGYVSLDVIERTLNERSDDYQNIILSHKLKRELHNTKIYIVYIAIPFTFINELRQSFNVEQCKFYITSNDEISVLTRITDFSVISFASDIYTLKTL